MKLLVHADDFGNSKSITDDILECFQASSSLSGTSIIPNGLAFEYAINKFNTMHHDRRLGVHINLREGRPCLPPNDIPLLVDKDGYFRHSFLSLVAAYYLPRKRRAELAGQVKAEIAAQIGRVQKKIVDGNGLYIDSHQHFHMIPFVFNLVVELKNKFHIEYIRIPKEKIFFHIDKNSISNYFGMNLIKHFLLNYLSSKCTRYLQGTDIRYPDYFVGVLFTGNMTMPCINKALSVLEKNGKASDLVVEILFHPGRAAVNETNQWSKYPNLKDYNLSSNRHREKMILMSDECSSLLKRYTSD
jgi:predicted glycoside hydrolase/deacetylase ChbG (UPF0249 family)